MRYLFFYPIALFLFFSCGEPTQSDESKEEYVEDLPELFKLEKTGEFHLPIGQESNLLPKRFELVERKGKRYLVSENSAKKTLEFYDIDAKSLVQEVQLATTGPNSVKCMSGFYVISLDSIITFCASSYSAFMVNADGEVMDKYSFIDNPDDAKDPDQFGLSKVYMLGGNMAINRNDTIFLPAVLMADYDNPEAFDKFYASQWLHWPSKTSGFVYKYPDIYREKNFNHLSTQIYRAINDKGEFVYSFQADPAVHRTDLYALNVVHDGRSRKFAQPTDIPYAHEDTKLEDMDKFAAITSNYKQIFYDPYRKMYYRFMIDEGKQTGSLRTAHDDSRISVILLDADLKWVGEYILPLDQLNYRNVFVAEEGLYISQAHPNNEALDENRMSFSIFQPKEI